MSERATDFAQLLRSRAASMLPWLAAPLFVFAINASLDARNRHTLASRFDHDQTLAPTVALRAGSLGHREWAADLVWIRALIYYGETISGAAAQRRLQDFARTAEELDPHFRLAYIWGATVSIYNNRRISRESVELSAGHLLRGLQYFPRDGEMLYQLGFLYRTEMTPFYRDDDERVEMHRRGALYLQQASSAGYGPAWMALSAASALREAGLNQQAIDHLRQVAMTTEDSATRERIVQRIQELTGTLERSPFDAELQRIESERAGSFPYMQPLLYLLVGPPLPGVAATEAASVASPTATAPGPSGAPSVSPEPPRRAR